jgi:uncharacterized RDD family membrane protein YckC
VSAGTPPLDTLFVTEAPEGIELAQRPAGLVPRCLAYAVDFGLRMAVYFVAVTGLQSLGGVGAAVYFILLFAMEWLYPVAFELSPMGATPGKRMLGLRVVMDNGLPVTPAASFTRNLLRTIDFMPVLYGFGLAALLLRADAKRIGDLAAGTLVVHDERVSLHRALPPAPPLAPRAPLSASAQAAVIAWAGRVPRLTAARAEELAELAKPVLPAGRSDATQRLLGIAHWLLGRRA